jgi:type IV pilus assembly protein PilO
VDELLARYSKVPIRRRLAAFGGIVVAVLAAHWFLIYSDQATELGNLEEQYTRLEQDRAEKQAYVENLQKYEARLTELQASLNLARSQLPDDPDVPQLLAQLGNKAKQAGLEIDRFEPKGEAPKDFYAEIIFDMKVHGSYHEIGTFLDAIGKLDRILNVTGLSMSNPRSVNQKIVVDCSFTIKTYRFMEMAEVAKGAKK